jgi:hypothetical protein
VDLNEITGDRDGVAMSDVQPGTAVVPSRAECDHRVFENGCLPVSAAEEGNRIAT